MAVQRKKLKKQLDASLLLNEHVFFIDRSLGHNQLAVSLRGIGEQVIVHDDIFSSDTPDDVWLAEAGKNGWIVLTHDTKIRYRKIEFQALLDAKTKAFVLTAKGLRGQEIVEVILGSISRIKKIVAKHDGPLLATISRSSKVTIKHPESKK